MGKRSKQRKARSRRKSPVTPTKRNAPSSRPAAATETQAAEAVTVAWMLTLLATLLAEVSSSIVRMVALRQAEPGKLGMLANLLFFIAVVSGIATVLLTPLTLSLRRTPPPRPLVVAAVVVGLLPLAVLLIRW